jgi:hypothetical protein
LKLFQCDVCRSLLHFEAMSCNRCGCRVGYDPRSNSMIAMGLEEDGQYSIGRQTAARSLSFCRNADHEACNWLFETDNNKSPFCIACRHNGVIPNLSNPAHLEKWRVVEAAKRRLFYSLLRWKLPLRTRTEDPRHGLIFKFLADPERGPKVMTGHDNGVITIALSEADDAERELRRQQMGEAYRTLLGHFRHEVGHHYWDLLVRDGDKLEQCRSVFGDDSQSYDKALARHYEKGPPEDWQANYVSPYATMHPWEDFAETWAHYIHIVAALETANAFGIEIRLGANVPANAATKIHFDPYCAENLELIMEAWGPFVFTINSVNRAMGKPDLYPFELSSAVMRKLNFIHQLVSERRLRAPQVATQAQPQIGLVA